MLSTNVNIDSFNTDHSCFNCDHSCFNSNFLLDENSGEIFDGLQELESSVPEDTKMVLLHIAGYVTCNDSTTRSKTIEHFIKKFREGYKPRLGKEPALKMLKLS